MGVLSPIVSGAIPIISILTDMFDGKIARKYNMKSKVGGILDVVGDRILELSYWIYFASTGAIPFWIPLLFASRGIIVDGIMGYARMNGYTRMSFTQGGISGLITSSSWGRGGFATVKAIAFALLAYGSPWGLLFAWLSLAFSLTRAVPVVIKSKDIFS